MSDFSWLKSDRRRRRFVIVEGRHEKDKLMWLLLKCFPEIDIQLEDILVYGTNIYLLYQEIVNEYGEDWSDCDIDLPYLFSKKQGINPVLRKTAFVDIVLIFDYEHHDPNFAKEKIVQMQEYFQDSTDVGKLYLNYPMVEAYQHLLSLPDLEYKNRNISMGNFQSNLYKNFVKSTLIARVVNLPRKMEDILAERFKVENVQKRTQCVEEILSLNSETALVHSIEEILSCCMNEERKTAAYQFVFLVKKVGYLAYNHTYFEYMRSVFVQVIIHNIRKANKVQNQVYEIHKEDLKKCFLQLDFNLILEKQNVASEDLINGIIWVLNTAVLFVPDYRFELIERIANK